MINMTLKMSFQEGVVFDETDTTFCTRDGCKFVKLSSLLIGKRAVKLLTICVFCYIILSWGAIAVGASDLGSKPKIWED